ncbi:MAG: hypothetical protein V7K15_24260 [Nostoc sp.]
MELCDTAITLVSTSIFLESKNTYLGLMQNISQTLISLCRASCYNGGNPRNALPSLRLCGSLRQAEASTLFRNLCVSPITKLS